MPVPLVHQTDLFRPHQDPDDHWDLLSVHALHQRGAISLEGILVDHPPAHHGGVPDEPGLEMLSELTGISPPYAIGASEPFRTERDTLSASANLLIDILERSPEPVVINIAGSCRDVAIALTARPQLFKDNSSVILLNAGAGYASSEIEDEIEYNVKLDVDAYRSIFAAPCSVLWCPCFERLGFGLKVHTHGTWYTFEQRQILGGLAGPLQAFLAYMFSKDTNVDWSRWLDPALYGPVIERQVSQTRPMWTTAGLVHASGFIEDDGFAFEPVRVLCRDNGTTTWVSAGPESNISKFRITDHGRYPAAMRSALRDLVQGIELRLES